VQREAVHRRAGISPCKLNAKPRQRCRGFCLDSIVKSTRRANHFGYSEIVSSHGIKNISVSTQPDSLHINSHPVLLRGALAIVTNEGRVAVDADVATDERD
jgi:hypothetical protein